jgi:hypothetical protein
VLDLLQQRPEDVVVHRQLTDLALRVCQPTIVNRRQTSLQALLTGDDEVLTPPADRAGRLTGLARKRVEALAPTSSTSRRLIGCPVKTGCSAMDETETR